MHADGAIDDVAIELRPPAAIAKYSFSIVRCWNLRAKLEVGLIGAGHEDHAAGVAVEAMDDARAVQPAAALKAGPK